MNAVGDTIVGGGGHHRHGRCSAKWRDVIASVDTDSAFVRHGDGDGGGRYIYVVDDNKIIRYFNIINDTQESSDTSTSLDTVVMRTRSCLPVTMGMEREMGMVTANDDRFSRLHRPSRHTALLSRPS